MIRTFVVAALVGLVGCGGEPTGASGGGEVALLTYEAIPTPAQVEAASTVTSGQVSLLRQARAVSLRTSVGSATLMALPGVAGVTLLGPDDDPTVSITILMDEAPTPQDVEFVSNLGADAVYVGGVGDGFMINALRLPLSVVPQLDNRPGVSFVEIHRSGPRVG